MGHCERVFRFVVAVGLMGCVEMVRSSSKAWWRTKMLVSAVSISCSDSRNCEIDEECVARNVGVRSGEVSGANTIVGGLWRVVRR